VVEFAYEQLLDIYIQNNRSVSAVSSWINDELKEFDLSTEKKDEINTKVRSFHLYIHRNLAKCNRSMTRFKTKHTEWLLSNMAITVSSFLSSNPKPSTSRPVGRPPIEYVNAGPRQKRKLAFDLAVNQGHNTSLLVHAAAMSVEKTNEKHTALMLKNTFLTPSDPNSVRNNFFNGG